MVDEQLSPLPLMTFPGEPAEIALPLRQIVSAALKSDCRFLLLGHSHGHGDPAPSTADIRTTRLLCRMLTPLRISLVDHIIYAGNARFSFREQGLL